MGHQVHLGGDDLPDLCGEIFHGGRIGHAKGVEEPGLVCARSHPFRVNLPDQGHAGPGHVRHSQADLFLIAVDVIHHAREDLELVVDRLAR